MAGAQVEGISVLGVEKEEMDGAATKVQAVFKGKKARDEVEELKVEKEALYCLKSASSRAVLSRPLNAATSSAEPSRPPSPVSGPRRKTGTFSVRGWTQERVSAGRRCRSGRQPTSHLAF